MNYEYLVQFQSKKSILVIYVLKPDLRKGKSKQDAQKSCKMIISVLNAQTLFIATNMSKYYLVELEDSVESEESEETAKVTSNSKDYAFNAEDPMRPAWFENLVRRAETLVFFYNPDICHCQYLLDEWEKLRRKHANDDFIQVGEVNCKTSPQTCESEKITQFPEIWRYR